MAGKKKAKAREVEVLQAAESVAVPSDNEREKAACNPVLVKRDKFNEAAVIPYGCTIDHVYQAMNELLSFLGFINTQLHTKGIQRFESMLMPANFSGMVGEFLISTIPKYCPTLVKNQYHNGHPDLLPKGMFAGDAVQHGTEGIEVKALRYSRGWQGHNAEECWLRLPSSPVIDLPIKSTKYRRFHFAFDPSFWGGLPWRIGVSPAGAQRAAEPSRRA
jgi:hypothetical protein